MAPDPRARRAQGRTHGKEPNVSGSGASSSCCGAAFLAHGGLERSSCVLCPCLCASCLSACVRVCERASGFSSAETQTHRGTGGGARRCIATVERQASLSLLVTGQNHSPSLAGHACNKPIKNRAVKPTRRPCFRAVVTPPMAHPRHRLSLGLRRPPWNLWQLSQWPSSPSWPQSPLAWPARWPACIIMRISRVFCLHSSHENSASRCCTRMHRKYHQSAPLQLHPSFSFRTSLPPFVHPNPKYATSELNK